MKLLFGNSWLRETIPADLEDEPMAGGTPESRFFVDHGAIHDRKTGQHVGMEAEIGCQERLFKLLCEMDSEIQRLQRLLAGETREAVAAERLEHVHITDKQAVVTGDPADFPDSISDDDPRRHNCDYMGCPRLDHVLYRLPFTDHRKPVDIKALAKDLAESIDFTAGPVQARELFNKKLAAISLYSSPHDDAGAPDAEEIASIVNQIETLRNDRPADWYVNKELEAIGMRVAALRKSTTRQDPHHG